MLLFAQIMQCLIAWFISASQFYSSNNQTMQSTHNKYRLLRIKAGLGVIALIAVSSAFMSFKMHRLYADVWQQLGISKEKGLKNIEESFLNGAFYYYGADKAKNILAGDRAAVAKDLLAYVKQQVNSDAFKKQYDQQRNYAKPVKHEQVSRTKEDIRKEKIAEAEKSIKETEANLKTMKPEMVKALQPMLDLLKNNLKDYKDPNSKMIDLFYQSELMSQDNNVRSYEESMKQWEEEYPADYRQVIKKRLHKFIDLAGTVDFSAELKMVNGKKKFVNPLYEAKAYDWKQIFRAGKEVIDPAVAFARQWINEIN
jgi:hypothetical protein